MAPLPGAAAGAHAEGAPPGRTGGFGEYSCLECHHEYPPNVDGTLEVRGLPERYAPGARYEIELVLRSDGMARAGFQAAFRYAAGEGAGRSAGTVAAGGSDVVVRPGGEGVDYVGHAPGGLWTEPGAPARWSIVWRAPDPAEAPVAFHAAANSADGDDSPFGDIVYTAADTTSPPI